MRGVHSTWVSPCTCTYNCRLAFHDEDCNVLLCGDPTESNRNIKRKNPKIIIIYLKKINTKEIS